jgi:hypothetical protein
MLLLFIFLQIILFLFLSLHDWVSVPPLNDIDTLGFYESNLQRLMQSILYGVAILIPLFYSLRYYQQSVIPFSVLLNISTVYFFLASGAILNWWVPYFFGSSQKHKDKFKRFTTHTIFCPHEAIM